MHTFADSKGRTWDLALTLGARARVQSRLQFDLLHPDQGEQPLAPRLAYDVEALINVLWVLCLPQAQAQDIDDQEFVEGLDGDAAWRATDAFFQEWQDFFLKLRKPEQCKVIEKTRSLLAKAVNLAARKVEDKAEEVGRQIDADQFQDGPSGTSGS